MRGEKSGTGVTGSQMRVPRPSTRLANRERTLETGAAIRGNRWITVDLASYRSPHTLPLCSFTRRRWIRIYSTGLTSGSTKPNWNSVRKRNDGAKQTELG